MPFPDAQIQLEVESYASLKLARGKDAALAWLRPRLSHGALGRAAKIIYFRNCDELLWALYDQDDPVGSWETWIYRAAAYLREREPDAAHRALLEKHFATPGSHFSDLVAATAIRGGDESAVLAQAHNDNELALAAYVFGVKAMHERDFHRMMRMYQLGVSTDPTLGGQPADAAGGRAARICAGLQPRLARHRLLARRRRAVRGVPQLPALLNPSQNGTEDRITPRHTRLSTGFPTRSAIATATLATTYRPGITGYPQAR